MRKIFGNAGAGFAGRGEGGIGTEGDEIESAEADAEVDFVSARANAGDDFAQEARAVFEGAAVLAGASVGAEEFVEEVAVAMFDVDEIGAGFGGEGGCFNIGFDQLLEFVVREDGGVRGDAEFFVENGMAIGDAGFQFLFVVRAAEAAGMGELKTDDEIVGSAVFSGVRGGEFFAEFADASDVFAVDDELVWIGAAVGTNSHGFAAENEFGAAFAEASPAPEHVIGDAAGSGAVPTFHGMNGDAIADASAVDGDLFHGAQEWGIGRGDGIVAGQIDAETLQMRFEIAGSF